VLWWVLFIVFSWFVARHYGIPFTKRDTVFVEMMRKSPGVAKMFRYDASSKETNAHFLPFMKYIICHLFCVFLAIAVSTVFWYNWWIHSAFVITCFISATYYGAIRYFNMMTKYYVKTLKLLLEDNIEQELNFLPVETEANQDAAEEKKDDMFKSDIN